jgi:hypothetical protein
VSFVTVEDGLNSNHWVHPGLLLLTRKNVSQLMLMGNNFISLENGRVDRSETELLMVVVVVGFGSECAGWLVGGCGRLNTIISMADASWMGFLPYS